MYSGYSGMAGYKKKIKPMPRAAAGASAAAADEDDDESGAGNKKRSFPPPIISTPMGHSWPRGTGQHRSLPCLASETSA